MSAAASGTAMPSRRRRVATILAFWLAAGGLAGIQFLILRHIVQLDRAIVQASPHLLVPSEAWRCKGLLVPALLALAALIMQHCWLKGPWRALSGFATTLFVPFALFGLLIADVRGPTSLQTLMLSDGRRVTLAIEPLLTDTVYTLYEDADPAGLVWRQVSDLNYSEDGRFNGAAHLVASADGDWLLVARAGLWTDCFRLVSGSLVRLDMLPHPIEWRPGYATDMRTRSERIAALTGLRP